MGQRYQVADHNCKKTDIFKIQNAQNSQRLLRYSNNAIDIIKFVKHFLKSTKDTQYNIGLKDSSSTGHIRAGIYGDLVYK